MIPFENTDDSYKSKMSAYYSEWSSMGDKFSDAGNAIRDFLAGIGDSLVDTVKGLLTLVVDLGLLYVHSECSRMTLGHVPETLDQEVEKIKQKYEPLLKDPVNTIGGIGQSICDTADEKGVAYSSGYIVTEVVTALLADKGLDKLKNVAKTGKTADNVADIAEGAAKGAESAAEDAGKAGKGLEEAAKGAESAAEDAGKAGKTAGKVGESGTYSWKIGSTEDAKYIGKGNVGDFSNLEGTTIEDILSRIPEDAVRRELIPEVGKVTEGFEYKWMQDGKTFRVRIHGIDASAPAGSNAANGWVVRVQQGKKYLSPISMEFQPPGITKIDSPYYSEELANSTHIPIQSPK